jgi:hypothetical protein
MSAHTHTPKRIFGLTEGQMVWTVWGGQMIFGLTALAIVGAIAAGYIDADAASDAVIVAMGVGVTIFLLPILILLGTVVVTAATSVLLSVAITLGILYFLLPWATLLTMTAAIYSIATASVLIVLVRGGAMAITLAMTFSLNLLWAAAGTIVAVLVISTEMTFSTAFFAVVMVLTMAIFYMLFFTMAKRDIRYFYHA